MRYELWKNPRFFYIFPILFTIAFVSVVVGVFYNKILIIVALAMLLVSICITMVEREFCAKIIITQNGLQWLWFGREVLNLSWNKIKSVEIKFGYSFRVCINYNDKKFNIEMTRKLYHAFMDVCPREDIKVVIEDCGRKYLKIKQKQ